MSLSYLDETDLADNKMRGKRKFIGREVCRNKYLKVKIIKEMSPTVFKVADATGFETLVIYGPLLDENKILLKEKNFLKITGYGIDYSQDVVYVDMETKISTIEEFPVDETTSAQTVKLKPDCTNLLRSQKIQAIFSRFT